MKNLSVVYFSATGTTKKIVKSLANEIIHRMNEISIGREYDITLPENREKTILFSKDDIVIVGMPVYAGRVPNVFVNFLKTIISNGAVSIPIVVYGNRNYDDALQELNDILESDGLSVIAGATFIGEHSFSRILGKGRPDIKDLEIVSKFSEVITEKLSNNSTEKAVYFKRNIPYRKHYMPRNRDGDPVDLRRVKPKTNSDCIDCKVCARSCPMGSINLDDVTEVNGICIKCGACIKKCPVNAKYYDDEGYLLHKKELEIEFVKRKEPEIFIWKNKKLLWFWPENGLNQSSFFYLFIKYRMK